MSRIRSLETAARPEAGALAAGDWSFACKKTIWKVSLICFARFYKYE
jgi:hypothetical protein